MSMGLATSASVWNGPVCGICGTCYYGSHTCGWSDLQRRIDELRDMQDRLPTRPPAEVEDDSCPKCGGSGMAATYVDGLIPCHLCQPYTRLA